jgi:hypothetical protein
LSIKSELARGTIAPAVQDIGNEALYATAEKAAEVPPIAQAVLQTSTPNYALWFLIGGLFVLILVIVFELFRYKKNKT